MEELPVLIARLPSPVKDFIKARIRYSAIRRALKPMKARGSLTQPEIAAFRKAWGNEGFSADQTFLAKLLKMLTAGPVLECGTGGTTLLENLAGLRKGFKTFCLEQDRSWAQDVIDSGPQAVKVVIAPLKDFGGYHWYDVPDTVPMHFALVVCDGPYIDKALGEPHYSAWRYGIFPWLKETGRTFDVMLLDDVNDARAPAILARWKREFGIKVEEIESSDGICAVITRTTQDTPTP